MIWLWAAVAAELPEVPVFEPDLPPPVGAPRAYDEADLYRSVAKLRKKKHSAEALVWTAVASRGLGDTAGLRAATDRFWDRPGPDHAFAPWMALQRWYAYGGEGDEAVEALRVAEGSPRAAEWARIAAVRPLVVDGQYEVALSQLDGIEHRDAKRLRLHVLARQGRPELVSAADQLLQEGGLSEEDALTVALVLAQDALASGEAPGEAVWSWMSERDRPLLLGDAGVAALALVGQLRAAQAILGKLVDEAPSDEQLPWRLRRQVQLAQQQGDAAVVHAFRLNLADRLGPGSEWTAVHGLPEEVRALVANELELAAQSAHSEAQQERSVQAWSRAAGAWELRMPWGYLTQDAYALYAQALVSSGQRDRAQELAVELISEGRDQEAERIEALLR